MARGAILGGVDLVPRDSHPQLRRNLSGVPRAECIRSIIIWSSESKWGCKRDGTQRSAVYEAGMYLSSNHPSTAFRCRTSFLPKSKPLLACRTALSTLAQEKSVLLRPWKRM